MNYEHLYTLALTRIGFFNPVNMLQLYKMAGSATAIYESRHSISDIAPLCPPRLAEALSDWGEPLQRATAEMEFMERHGISAIAFNDDDYPQRLRECNDAPVILYYKGVVNLNCQHIINIIGTRHATTYGQDMVRRLLSELRLLCPDVLIVSGLAYGIDICAHREALANGFDTIGVLAHGLDQIYPPRHRDTAYEMLQHGGLLTEFMSQTNADKQNFVRRNRIVAGMSDATVLVESASKGGGLITCSIARSYSRDVFAFPGAVGARYSEGCNSLIRDNGAALITSAADLVSAMGWAGAEAKPAAIERQLFPSLSEEEQHIVSFLQQCGDQQLNVISVRTGMPISQLSALLFQLEMKGVVKPMAGGNYHLLK